MASRRFCVQCGHALKPEARFCTTCGHIIRGSDGDEAARPDPGEAATLAGLGLGGADPGPAAAGPEPHPPGPQPRVRGWRSFRWPVVIAIVVLIGAVAGSAAGLITRRAGHAGSVKTPKPTAPISATPSASPASSPATEPARQQAAQGLSALLAQSVAVRGSVVSAFSDLARCGPQVAKDAAAFRQAAASRERLISRLAALPGRSTLPAPAIAALTKAWQTSVQADQDFAAWAQDENSHGCHKNGTSDPHFRAATGPDNRATGYKKAFAASWNPIAAQYGLPTYQWDRL
jgi:zinc-ribbon domain